MIKLTINILAENGFDFIPGSHSLMSNGKGIIVNTYDAVFTVNGKPVEFVEELERKAEAGESFQDTLQKKTKKK